MDTSSKMDASELSQKLIKLKMEISKAQQTCQDLKNRLKHKKAYLSNQERMMELAMSEENEEKVKFDAKLSQLETSLKQLKLNHQHQIEGLQLEVVQKIETSSVIQTEIDTFKQVEIALVDTNEEYDKSLTENLALRETVNSLQNQYNDVEKKLKEMQKTIEERREDIKKLKATIDLNKIQLSETSDQIESANDELFEINTELSLIERPTPQENPRKSLFNEVNDRRVELQDTVDELRKIYQEQKKEYEENCKLTSTLQKEVENLKVIWKKDLEQIESDYYEIRLSLESRQKMMQDMINNLKKPEESKPLNEQIKEKNKTIKELKEKISNWTLAEYRLSSNLFKRQKDAVFLQSDLEDLKEDITTIKNESTLIDESDIVPETDPEVNVLPTLPKVELKSCLKKTTIPQDDLNKENIVKGIAFNDEVTKEEKGIKFSDNTVLDKTTNSNFGAKGQKVFIFKKKKVDS